MATVTAPAMVWFYMFRKLSTRSSLAVSICFMCLLVMTGFVIFTVIVVFPRGYYSTAEMALFNVSRLLAQFYEERAFKIENSHMAVQKPLIFIAVVSAFQNFEQRNSIRATWGHPLTQLSENVIVRFFTGLPPVDSNSTHMPVLFNETARFDDEIQLPIKENYLRLASKSELLLEWLANHGAAPSYFTMKVDDDTFVNLPLLASYIRHVREDNLVNDRPLFFCYLHVNATPVRDNVSTWYVDHALYNVTRYPSYCSGSAYLFTSEIIQPLARQVDLISKDFARIKPADAPEVPEDVLVTGFAAARLNINHVDMKPFFECCYYLNQSSVTSSKHKSLPSPKPNVVEWLCRRATEGAMVLHPLKHAQTNHANLMGALLVASLIGSYHDCINSAMISSSFSSSVASQDDPLGSILTIREVESPMALR